MVQTSRDYRFDNIKGIMIFCVIFTHAISNLYKGWADVTVTKYLYFFIYMFHMPVFIFISGYFSKIKTDYDTYIRKAICNCLIPYLIFNFLYGLPSLSSAINIFRPKWTLWYLLSLFFWKIAVLIIPKFKWALVLTILLALYIGLVGSAGSYLSISRTICFFPFFYAGYICQENTVEKVRERNKILPWLALVIAMIVAGVLTSMKLPSSTLFFNTSYSGLEQTYIKGILIRSVLIICGFLCIFFFVSVIPQCKTIISGFGMYSITIYLAHSMVIRVLKFLNIINIANPYVFLLFDLVFALVLCLLFGNRWIAKAYHWVFNKIAELVVLNSKSSSQEA